MVLFVALFEGVLSISYLWSLVAFCLMMGTILSIFAPEQIQKRVGPKVLKTRFRREDKRLPWPVYFAEYGAKLWFLAAIFVVVEILTEIIEFGSYIGSPILVYGFFLIPGIILFIMAIVPTFYAVMFIANSTDEPPRIARYYRGIVGGLLLLTLDVSEAYLFSLFLPLFNDLLPWAQLFTVLLVVSIFCSACILWAMLRTKEPHAVMWILRLGFSSPYLLLGAVGVITLLSRFLLGLPL